MNILWISNILFPEAHNLLTGNNQLKSSGGWMLGAANAITKFQDANLCVGTVSSTVNRLTYLEGKRISYYIIPLGAGNTVYNDSYESYWIKINEEFKPDVVHIYGTEFSQGLAFIKACGNQNVVVSIQGLVSVYARYYLAGISIKTILKHLTVHDLLKGSMLYGQRAFSKRGRYERELISNVKHIIGRTSWDKAHTWVLNSKAKYYFCNETLRDEFYQGFIWNYFTCNKHSIFLSQGGVPLKGLHQVLLAMPIILSHFPDTTLRIAGKNMASANSFLDYLRINGYGNYIKSLIKKYSLHDKVIFLGNLDADEMKNEYLKSNVFVCPSSIENSPNSLGEAQILGVPCIASFVGGVADMMRGNEDYLYRFEEIEMLAYKICYIFSSCENVSNSIEQAKLRHSSEKNANDLVEIYKTITKDNSR